MGYDIRWHTRLRLVHWFGMGFDIRRRKQQYGNGNSPKGKYA
jgi:hypothetical protein